jgi:hypothetical protein
MSKQHEKRSRLVGVTIRQESWNLENLRNRHRQALDELTKTKNALREVDVLIEQTEKAICRAMEGDEGLDLLAIQSARQFLQEQRNLRKLRHSENQRATQKEVYLEAQLLETALYVKGLQQVKAISDKAVNIAKEKQETEQNTELWVQRFVGKEWRTCR